MGSHEEVSPFDNNENDTSEIKEAQKIHQPSPLPNNDMEAKVENFEEYSRSDVNKNETSEVEESEEIHKPSSLPNNNMEAKVENHEEESQSDINVNDTAGVELAQTPDPYNDDKEEESTLSIFETDLSQV